MDKLVKSLIDLVEEEGQFQGRPSELFFTLYEKNPPLFTSLNKISFGMLLKQRIDEIKKHLRFKITYSSGKKIYQIGKLK